MAKPGLQNISTTNTFQTWLDRTNEIVDIVKDETITASVIGDVTGSVGVPLNATLIESFTANTITASTTLRADSILPRIGSLDIGIGAPVRVNTSTQVGITLTNSSGPRTVFNSGSVEWRVGFEDIVTNNFIIDTGLGTRKVSITPFGNVTIPGRLTTQGGVTGNLTGNVTGNLTGDVTGNLTGDVTGDLTGVVTGTVSSLSNHNTNALAEGSNNLYFTTARARSSISGGTGISYNSSTGQINATIDANQIRGFFSGGTGVSYNNTTGVISIGQAVATNSNVTFNNITATGSINANGDITAFASSSDIRKKENIVRINNALEKVLQINGYTYNFKGDDRKLAGVIAQELELVLPEVVYEIDDAEFGGSTKAIRYGNIVGLLIEAIKDLKRQLDAVHK